MTSARARVASIHIKFGDNDPRKSRSITLYSVQVCTRLIKCLGVSFYGTQCINIVYCSRSTSVALCPLMTFYGFTDSETLNVQLLHSSRR